MTCDNDGYPSVWDDYVVLTIGWSDYICDEGAFGDMPCVRYYGGSPSGYPFWSPDYYCDKWSYSRAQPAKRVPSTPPIVCVDDVLDFLGRSPQLTGSASWPSLESPIVF